MYDQDQDLVHQIARSATDTLIDKMGIQFTEARRERLVATMPVAGNTQPYGLLHGGASAVLAETLGSVGAMLWAGENRVAVGIELNITHHRAARSGVVTGVAVPVHTGGTLVTYEIDVTDEQDRRICSSRLTCLLRDLPPGA